jgi:7,8-dihydroneopterin aldolase/epimerase/oxygenase
MRATRQRIVIADLTIACRIGVTDKERANLQRLRINLALDVQPAPPRLDRISEVVDYGKLATRVRDVCTEAEFRLLETLAGRLAATCFEDSRVERVVVRIEKLDRYPDMAAIGCETVYERGDV